ncbi:MAG: TraB/GumN family protein [Chitinophagales bacterium]
MRLFLIQILLLTAVLLNAKMPNALIWEISHPDIEHKSYLMGTIHIADARVLEFFETYKAETFDHAETVALEIEMDGNVFENIFQLMVPEASYNMKAHLSEADYQQLSEWLKKKHGMKLSRFERIKPIFFYFLINDFGPGADNQMFLDEYIYHLAEENDKKRVGLEDVSEQIAAFDSIPYSDQFELLLSSLDQRRGEKRAYNKLLKAYTKQNLNKLEKLMVKEMPDIFYEMLIDRRNENMTAAMLPILKESASFIAVGAGHLPGENGLIKLLRKEGYILKPVSN